MRTGHKIVSVAAVTALICSVGTGLHAGSGDVEENLLLQLKALIEKQQQQLDNQATEIAKLKEQLGLNSEQIEKKADKEELEGMTTAKMVTSKFEHVEVSLYGHLNRGVLWSDNGDSSKAFFVDNSNSQSRLGLNAAVSPSDNMIVGGKIEYGIKSNASTDVSQNDTNDATSVNWNLRHADVFFNPKQIGKFSLGHGSAASDGSSEVDLSGTSVVAYSDVEALSGGQYFYDNSSGTLTDTRVKNVFNNMDGLGRDDRLRYDTPSFQGASLSTSAVSGDGYDVALKYSRGYDETKVAATVAWATPGDSNDSVDNQYSGSFSFLFGNGLNFTMAGGMQEFFADGRDDATFWYGKIGYRLSVCSLGKTSLSLDYSEHQDVNNGGDEATTWSIAAVQDIPSWGTELYLSYRNYSLDTESESLDDVNAVLGGARVKF